MFSRHGKEIIISLLVFVAILLGYELRVRHSFSAWPFEIPLYVPDYMTERDAPLRWRFSPGGGRNSLGLRNREIVAKTPGTTRILFLGDSLVWTGDTSSGKLYTEVLETQLNAHSTNSQQAFEVINAGVPGYTTYQELEFLKIYGMDMKPDYVILGFVFNDLYYKYLHRPTDPSLLGFEPSILLNRIDSDSFGGLLFSHSYAANQATLGTRILWRRIQGRQMYPFELKTDFYLAWKSHAWTREQALIGEMRDLLEAKSIPLAIVVFPISDQMNDQYLAADKSYVLYPQTRIKQISDHYQIPMLDLTEPIYTNGGAALFRDYLHMNPKGNDLVESEVEKFVAKEWKLVPQ